MKSHLAGIVVPTLGTRNELLTQSLLSVRAAGPSFIVIVTPTPTEIQRTVDQSLFDLVIADPGIGLANAINFGVESLPDNISFFNWLGDDDLLSPHSLQKTIQALHERPKAAAVFGGCTYIDTEGTVLWNNKSGSFAKLLMRFGPQLIPQPGALIRRSEFDRIGGLNNQYKWAFDLDMFIRLSQIGDLIYIPENLASFRWHPDSLSVKGRTNSVLEASKIRRDHYPKWLSKLFVPWEFAMTRMILRAGHVLTKTSKVGNQFGFRSFMWSSAKGI